jgi:hypothetical protein
LLRVLRYPPDRAVGDHESGQSLPAEIGRSELVLGVRSVEHETWGAFGLATTEQREGAEHSAK